MYKDKKLGMHCILLGMPIAHLTMFLGYLYRVWQLDRKQKTALSIAEMDGSGIIPMILEINIAHLREDSRAPQNDVKVFNPVSGAEEGNLSKSQHGGDLL